MSAAYYRSVYLTGWRRHFAVIVARILLDADSILPVQAFSKSCPRLRYSAVAAMQDSVRISEKRGWVYCGGTRLTGSGKVAARSYAARRTGLISLDCLNAGWKSRCFFYQRRISMLASSPIPYMHLEKTVLPFIKLLHILRTSRAAQKCEKRRSGEKEWII